MTLIVSSKAKGHLRAIRVCYENERPGLGKRFLKTVTQKLEVIESAPTRFAVQFDDVRIARVDSFPYLILFCIGEKNVRVIGVLHHSRNPELWKRL